MQSRQVDAMLSFKLRRTHRRTDQSRQIRAPSTQKDELLAWEVRCGVHIYIYIYILDEVLGSE